MKRAKQAASGKRSRARVQVAPGADLEKQIAVYVRKQNAALLEVTNALRQFVKKTVPKSLELINPWGVPMFAWRGPLVYLMVGKNHVTFGFPRGAELPDPAHLLEGTGKKLRHVKIREKEQLLDANLRDLILSAVSLNRRDPQPSKLLPRVTGGRSTADRKIDAAFAAMDRIRANSKKPKNVTIRDLRDEGRR